ncbi:MAG: OadG family protein [Thermodesulfobacteriota bacterium]|nr:OadG family protein [Thermodesulfobacteriota bacterium]
MFGFDMAEALKVFVIGFGGVFSCLVILMFSVMIFGKVVGLFVKKEKNS